MFIYATLSKGREGVDCRRALGHLKEGGWQGVTSSLVIDEVLWSVWKNASKELALETAERIYTIPHLSVIGVSEAVPRRAFRFIREDGLKPRDAFHAATMLEAGLTTIVSTDTDFDRPKGLRRLEPGAVGSVK